MLRPYHEKKVNATRILFFLSNLVMQGQLEFSNYVNDPEAITNPVAMSSMCVVFAETEIIGISLDDYKTGNKRLYEIDQRKFMRYMWRGQNSF